MRLDTERERGNIGADTEIVNDGEYMGYAEVTYGPWAIVFQRAREATIHFHPKPERVTVKGPFMDDDLHDGDHRDMEITVGIWQKVTEAIGTWDYVEAAEDEVFTAGD